METPGVIYCATGSSYVREAVDSIQSLREVEPGSQVVVFTDSPGAAHLAGIFGETIDLRLIDCPSYSWDDKLGAIAESPFERTVFLDTDTYVVRPFLNEMEKALEHFELLALPGMGFNLEWENREYSDCLSQMNTGVIVYKRCTATEGMFRLWRKLREAKPESHDQPTFREAIVLSGVRFAPLRVEYNYQGNAFTFGEIRIVHLISKRMRRIFKDPRRRDRELALIRSSGLWSFAAAAETGFLVHNGRWCLLPMLRAWAKQARRRYLKTPDVAKKLNRWLKKRRG